MHLSIAPLVEIYKTNTGLLLAALKDVSGEAVVKRPGDSVNSLHFVAGHMTNSRYAVGNLIGLSDQCPWPGLFSRGARVKDISEYPPIFEIVEAWSSISEKVISRLSELTEEDLRVPAPGNFPVDDKTMLGAIAFLALHDSYHVGQLGYVRKFFNYSPLAD
jgi:uncharacterized damage-inducible protein DinB